MALASSRARAFLVYGRSVGLWMLTWLALASAAWAQNLQSVPDLTAHVVDRTGTLNVGQRQALEAKLTAFEQTRGIQIVLLLVPTTQPEDIMSYTRRVGDTWQIGSEDPGAGLLIVVATNDRAMRIATSMALEGLVPDQVASRFITQDIRPRFEQGDIAGGLNVGTDRLMALISNQNFTEPDAGSNGLAEWDLTWIEVAVYLLFGVVIAARLLPLLLGRKRAAMVVGITVGVLIGYLGTSVPMGVGAAVAGTLLAFLASLNPRGGVVSTTGGSSAFTLGLGGGNWRTGSGSSSSSGGFSSGGGGDFGGGGASGTW